MQHLVLIDGDNQRSSRRPTPPRLRRLTPVSHARLVHGEERVLTGHSISPDCAIRSDCPRVLALHREPAVQTNDRDAANSHVVESDDWTPGLPGAMPRYIRNALKLHTWIVQQPWIVRVAKTCW